jgi:GNAT superfamily N-acetyltransferase
MWGSWHFRRPHNGRARRMVVADCPCAGAPDAFHELAERVYRRDKMQIPRARDHVDAALREDNEWFDQGAARLLVVPGGARAIAFSRPGVRVDGRPASFFGLWESSGDPAAEVSVMTAVKDFAREHGSGALVGPVDFSAPVRYRLRLSAEPRGEPLLGEPYNPPWYPRRLRALGLRRRGVYLTQVLDGGDIERALRANDSAVASLERQGYTFEQLDADAWLTLLPELRELTNKIFAEELGFSPAIRTGLENACAPEIAARLDPYTSGVGFGPDGRVAALSLCFPNYAPLVRRAAGADAIDEAELSWAEHAPVLRDRGELKLVLRHVAAAPDHRGRGLARAMATWSLQRAAEEHAVGAFASLIHVDSPSRRLAATCSGRRWYALFETPLDAVDR